MKTIKRAALAGPGALGITYALPLREYLSEGDFMVLASGERRERYEKDGFLVNDRREDFPIRTPEEAGVCDLVIIATKFGAFHQTARAIASCVGPDTIVLSLLNGVLSEEVLKELYPPENVPNAYVVALASGRTGNVIRLIKSGLAVFGYAPGASRIELENLNALEALFTGAKINYKRSEDILTDQWIKFMTNCGVNQVSAVLNLDNGDFKRDEHAKALLRAAFEEVARIAVAEGIDLGPRQVEASFAQVESMADAATSSMCQDVRNRAKTEVDMFAGHVMALGEKHGIETPVNRMLYHMIHNIENRF